MFQAVYNDVRLSPGDFWNHLCPVMTCQGPETIPSTRIQPGNPHRRRRCPAASDGVLKSSVWCVCRLSPAAYYAQRMIQYLSRRDSIRQRSLRYQQNRLRAMSTSSDSSASNPSNSMDNNDVDLEELE